MADQKPTSNYYNNLGGVNLKSSAYEMSTAQFLNLRNVDFDTPKALGKRPGSTQSISVGTSGPISSIFEFSKLTGQSYVIAGSDTAMFYMAGGGLTLLSPGWNNGQPTDMLTFVNKLWMANGQKYQFWDGLTLSNAGFTSPPGISFLRNPASGGGASWFLVAGETHIMDNTSGLSLLIQGIWFAYSYVRNDGFQGPVNFLAAAHQIVGPELGGGPTTSGAEWFGGSTWGAPGGQPISGFTAPPGVTAFNIWLAHDFILGSVPSYSNGASGIIDTGSNSIGNGVSLASFGGFRASAFIDAINPSVDVTQFKLFTSIPATTATFILKNFNLNSFMSAGPQQFSGMSFDWYATYIPKYIEVNQNIMFTAGFSSAPSLVWFSDVGEPETIDPENSFEVRTNEGDRIYAMKSYQDNMTIMKEQSFYKIIGDSADNYQLVAVSNDYGCISNKTVIEYKQKLLWLDRKGILEYSGANYSIISDPVEPIFRRMNLSAAREHACAVHHIYRNQVWFGIPIDGATQNNITVVYDYLVGGWTFFDGFNPDSFALVKASLVKPTVWRGDYSGFLHYFSESFYGDNGSGITCLGLTRFDNVGGENQTTIWRRFFLDVTPAVGLTGTIHGSVFSNYDTATVQATFSMFQSLFQSRAEFGVVAKSVSVEFAHYSASLPLLVSGYGLATRTLRNV